MSDRCSQCAHPLAEGEWTRCDEGCRHVQVGRVWSFEFSEWRYDQVGPATENRRVEARGRGRAEERDCPNCDGGGILVDPVGSAGMCPLCDPRGSGRVRPKLCQACERIET